MVSIQNLQYFMKVCEMNSFSKAAEVLYISQPALSLAIKNLERDLDVVLFQRSNRGIVLTEAGEKLYTHSDLLMQQMELIEHIGMEESEEVLSVSAFPYLVYPEILSRLLEPSGESNICLNFQACRVWQILKNVSMYESEIGVIQYNNRQEAIVMQELKNMNLKFDKFCSRPWAIAVGKHSPLYDLDKVRMEMLLPYAQLRLKDDLFSLHTGEIRLLEQQMHTMKRHFVDSQAMISYLLKKTDMYIFCCMQKRCLPGSYKVRIIPLEDVDIKITVGIVYKKNHHLSHAANRFIELLKEDWS